MPSNRNFWSDEEDRYLRAVWNTGVKLQEIALKLKRTQASVQFRASKRLKLGNRQVKK